MKHAPRSLEGPRISTECPNTWVCPLRGYSQIYCIIGFPVSQLGACPIFRHTNFHIFFGSKPHFWWAFHGSIPISDGHCMVKSESHSFNCHLMMKKPIFGWLNWLNPYFWWLNHAKPLFLMLKPNVWWLNPHVSLAKTGVAPRLRASMHPAREHDAVPLPPTGNERKNSGLSMVYPLEIIRMLVKQS